MRLHGREDDLKLLKSKLRELSNGDTGNVHGRPELLVISGISGAGKSALVMRGLRDPAEKMGIVFVSGKFDQNAQCRTQPLSAFVEAVASLAKTVLSGE